MWLAVWCNLRALPRFTQVLESVLPVKDYMLGLLKDVSAEDHCAGPEQPPSSVPHSPRPSESGSCRASEEQPIAAASCAEEEAATEEGLAVLTSLASCPMRLAKAAMRAHLPVPTSSERAACDHQVMLKVGVWPYVPESALIACLHAAALRAASLCRQVCRQYAQASNHMSMQPYPHDAASNEALAACHTPCAGLVWWLQTTDAWLAMVRTLSLHLMAHQAHPEHKWHVERICETMHKSFEGISKLCIRTPHVSCTSCTRAAGAYKRVRASWPDTRCYCSAAHAVVAHHLVHLVPWRLGVSHGALLLLTTSWADRKLAEAGWRCSLTDLRVLS